MYRLFAFLLLSVVGVCVGCNSAPSIGDQMKTHGNTAEQLGKQWNQGEKLLKRGNKLSEQSSKLFAEAETKKAKAAEMIEKGQQLMDTSQGSFAEKFPGSN